MGRIKQSENRIDRHADKMFCPVYVQCIFL